MTNQDFRSQLEKLTRTPNTFEQIPPLINKARAEHLSIPVVFHKSSGEFTIVSVQDKPFILCATSMLSFTNQLESGLRIGETDLDGFFEDLIECGYCGIAFRVQKEMLALEWRDFIPGQKIVQKGNLAAENTRKRRKK